MFGANDLKAKIVVKETTVECPVRDCSKIVTRQSRTFRREPQFQCPIHGIYISPSTFEYQNETDNFLWRDQEDIALLREIGAVKRESRMARDNSEDALTWNVFRYLEKTNQVDQSLSSLTDASVIAPQLMYWSYSQDSQGVWPILARARKEFGEHPSRSSEPDLIVISESALFFIEAKLTATNKTTPSRPNYAKKYLTGGSSWFQRVFRSDYDTLAIQERKYELTRFWLLGSWIAETLLDVDFYLVNLVLEEREENIEQRFKPHLRLNNRRFFLRWTWESIYQIVSRNTTIAQAKDLFTSYFENKTIGYNHLRELQLAFQVIQEAKGSGA